MSIESDIKGKDDIVFMGSSDSIFTIPDSDTSSDEESIHEWDTYMDNNQGEPDLYIQDDQESLNNIVNLSSLSFQFDEWYTESDTNFPEVDIHNKNEWYPFSSGTFAILYSLATSTSLAFNHNQLCAI
ncbi:hypothetical protein L873DRAFT_1793781 [Choiromyces venosus 120613-1]|uniref:Uncharacterized protein n=1 Tax=Choiromyces venosus 120613-1 TaxID=1336337 RepID=A0A3N4JH78_9PEZI|nr:hypothetical protein L873DRAFT_1793781 [Choiromyces venosus 120613-1]